MLRLDESAEEASEGGDTCTFSASSNEECPSPVAQDSISILRESSLAEVTKAHGVDDCWPLPPNAHQPGELELSNGVHPCYDENIEQVLRYIKKYQPQLKKLSAPLKVCMTNYVPATGNVETLLKIPRPDGKEDNLGLTSVDEPAIEQSNPALLNLKLRTVCMRRLAGEQRQKPVGRITHAEDKPDEIDRWIRGVEALHEKYHLNEVQYSQLMPSTGSLMQVWPARMQQTISSHWLDTRSSSTNRKPLRQDALLNAYSLDLTISEVSKVVCSLLGIPWQKHRLIESLHVLWRLYLDYKDNIESSSAFL